MNRLLWLAVPAVLAGCSAVELVQPHGTDIAGVTGFRGQRWAIIRYVDKGSAEALAKQREEAARLMREYCDPKGFLVFEKERIASTRRVRMKFRCEGSPSPSNKAGG